MVSLPALVQLTADAGLSIRLYAPCTAWANPTRKVLHPKVRTTGAAATRPFSAARNYKVRKVMQPVLFCRLERGTDAVRVGVLDRPSSTA